MKHALVVFDLDGTLLDTIGDLAAACNHILRMRSLPEYDYKTYCGFVGNGITRLIERALPERLRTAEYVEAARRDFVDYYTAHIDVHTRPYSGVAELLGELEAQGCRLAVASNKFHEGTAALVARFFPQVHFGAVYGNREGMPLKPDAALLQAIMRECDSEAARCCMVGDSGVDMQTAHNAGTHSIGVTWGFRSREELAANGAERIADTAAEVLGYLREYGIAR